MTTPPYPYETSNIIDWEGDQPRGDAPLVGWADPTLKRITRLRLVSDQGCPFWDVSYCWGVLQDGTACRVQLPFGQLPRGRGKVREAILAHARREGVYAKRTGIFDDGVLSLLW